MKKRTLPEAAYDFFTEDGYDGEETGPFDTLAEAKQECRCLRAALPSYERPRIQVTWRLSEAKIRRMLVDAQKVIRYQAVRPGEELTNAARGRDECGVNHEELIDNAQRVGIQKAIVMLENFKAGTIGKL